MPRVQASFSLPYLLKLADGLYSFGPQGETIDVRLPHRRKARAAKIPTLITVVPQQASPLPSAALPDVTTVSIASDRPDTESRDEQNKLNAEQAKRLLQLANRLIRSYRAVTRDAAISELSRAQASLFRFQIVAAEAGTPTWQAELPFEAGPPTSVVRSTAVITERVRDILASRNEPNVADLFLLDAEQAIQEGRFREAVLFCWSTIDATFSRRYDMMVDEKLAREWREAKNFFKGLELGLRNKMSAALYLLSGRSLFREPGNLWQSLSTSYSKRNGIIHRGESATEDDALQALDVAKRFVEIMATS